MKFLCFILIKMENYSPDGSGRISKVRKLNPLGSLKVKTGLWIDWHKNGERKLETHWKRYLEGKFLSWHPDGNPQWWANP